MPALALVARPCPSAQLPVMLAKLTARTQATRANSPTHVMATARTRHHGDWDDTTLQLTLGEQHWKRNVV